MKWCVCILLLWMTNYSSAQKWQTNVATIHSGQLAKKATVADSLAKALTASSKTELEKVRSIFYWITDNISYQTTRFSRYKPGRHVPSEHEDTSAALISLDERIANAVIRKKEAVCDGYARLFKTLCDYAGIRSEVITGYARTNMSRGRPQFRSNHKWNAVMIDSTWHLLDATWASGFFSFADDFIKSYDSRYFLTPPQNFIDDHYPEDLRWTLLNNPPALREFKEMPFRYSGFVKRRILSYAPATGFIEAAVGDTLLFEMETDDVDKKLWVTDSLLVDTAEVSVFASLPKPVNKLQRRKVSYNYIVPPKAVQWLYVIYNDEIVLRYRLDVKTKSIAGRINNLSLQ